MTLIVAFLLGLIQGIAEFLPISSSGHLVLLSKIFGIQNNIFLISILLHFATLFVIVFSFRKQIWDMIKRPLSKDAINLYLATVFTFLLVVFYKVCLGDFFENSKLLPFGFLATAMLLLLTYFLTKNTERNNQYSKDYLTIKKSSATLMGIAQGFAVLPGISRLGSTMCVGMLTGENKNKVVEFSFILSIPIILASLIYEVFRGSFSSLSSTQNVFPLIVAFLTAFFVGLIFIKLMLKVVEKGKYYWFSVYLIILSIFSFFII